MWGDQEREFLFGRWDIKGTSPVSKSWGRLFIDSLAVSFVERSKKREGELTMMTDQYIKLSASSLRPVSLWAFTFTG